MANHLYEIATGRLVSSTTLPITVIPEGMAVKVSLLTGVWNASTLDFDPRPVSPVVSTGAFFDRFTQAELESLITLSRTTARAAVFLKRLDLKESVDLTSQELIDDVTAMDNAGVITTVRAQGDFECLISLGGGAYSFTSSIGSISQGVAVDSSATAHTLGSIVEMVASTEAVCNSFSLTICKINDVSLVDSEFLINLYVGGSGSEEFLVEGILHSADNTASNLEILTYTFPVAIPAGTRVSAAVQGTLAAADGLYMYMTFFVPSFDSHPGYGEVISIGHNTAATTSTIVVDSGGTANVKGAWVEIEASSQGYEGCLISLGVNANAALTNTEYLFDIAVGASGSEVVVISNITASTTASERARVNTGFFGIKLPAGERISVRSQSSITGASDRIRTLVFHGVR